MQSIFTRYKKRKQKMRELRKKSFENQFKNDSDAIVESFRQVGKDLNQAMFLINECIGIVAKDKADIIKKN